MILDELLTDNLCIVSYMKVAFSHNESFERKITPRQGK